MKENIMERQNMIKWNKNYIELHSEENGCRYCTCKIEKYFDPDSDERVVNHYIDFFFDIIDNKKSKAKIIKTGKIWEYRVRLQEGSGVNAGGFEDEGVVFHVLCLADGCTAGAPCFAVR